MKEIIDKIQRSGFPCPYRNKALCTIRCENHTSIFSAWAATALVDADVKLSGKELSNDQLMELIETGIQRSMIEGTIKEIDCRPTFPESQ